MCPYLRKKIKCPFIAAESVGMSTISTDIDIDSMQYERHFTSYKHYDTFKLNQPCCISSNCPFNDVSSCHLLLSNISTTHKHKLHLYKYFHSISNLKYNSNQHYNHSYDAVSTKSKLIPSFQFLSLDQLTYANCYNTMEYDFDKINLLQGRRTVCGDVLRLVKEVINNGFENDLLPKYSAIGIDTRFSGIIVEKGHSLTMFNQEE